MDVEERFVRPVFVRAARYAVRVAVVLTVLAAFTLLNTTRTVSWPGSVCTVFGYDSVTFTSDFVDRVVDRVAVDPTSWWRDRGEFWQRCEQHKNDWRFTFFLTLGPIGALAGIAFSRTQQLVDKVRESRWSHQLRDLDETTLRWSAGILGWVAGFLLPLTFIEAYLRGDRPLLPIWFFGVILLLLGPAIVIGLLHESRARNHLVRVERQQRKESAEAKRREEASEREVLAMEAQAELDSQPDVTIEVPARCPSCLAGGEFEVMLGGGLRCLRCGAELADDPSLVPVVRRADDSRTLPCPKCSEIRAVVWRGQVSCVSCGQEIKCSERLHSVSTVGLAARCLDCEEAALKRAFRDQRKDTYDVEREWLEDSGHRHLADLLLDCFGHDGRWTGWVPLPDGPPGLVALSDEVPEMSGSRVVALWTCDDRPGAFLLVHEGDVARFERAERPGVLEIDIRFHALKGYPERLWLLQAPMMQGWFPWELGDEEDPEFLPY